MTNQPDGAALLASARSTLMTQLLPLLPPDKAYAARMIARAMGIAARELQQREELACATKTAIADFLAGAGLGDLPADERTLSRLIRDRQLDAGSRRALPALLLTLTRHKLAISNPGHLS